MTCGLLLSVMMALAAVAVAQSPALVGKVQGRITELDTGRPINNLRVGLVGKTYSRDGVLELTVSATADTDETGAYTILAKPGRYYLATAAETADGTLFVPQYFPGSSDVASAVALSLSDGIEMHDINIAVPSGKRVSVSGRLLDGLGRKLPHLDWVWLVPRDAMGGATGQILPTNRGGWRSHYRNAGRYGISGVISGLYYLMSWRFEDIQQRAETTIPIEVGASDVEVDVVSYKGYPVNGRFHFQGASSFSVPQPNALGPRVQVFARSLDGSPVSDPVATINRTRLFSFFLPAGTYRLSILGIPAPF